MRIVYRVGVSKVGFGKLQLINLKRRVLQLLGLAKDYNLEIYLNLMTKMVYHFFIYFMIGHNNERYIYLFNCQKKSLMNFILLVQDIIIIVYF